MATIRETDTATLREWLRLLQGQAAWGNSKQQATSLRIKIRAIEVALEERKVKA